MSVGMGNCESREYTLHHRGEVEGYCKFGKNLKLHIRLV